METLYTIVTPWPFFCGGFQFLSFLFHDSVVTVELCYVTDCDVMAVPFLPHWQQQFAVCQPFEGTFHSTSNLGPSYRVQASTQKWARSKVGPRWNGRPSRVASQAMWSWQTMTQTTARKMFLLESLSRSALRRSLWKPLRRAGRHCRW